MVVASLTRSEPTHGIRRLFDLGIRFELHTENSSQIRAMTANRSLPRTPPFRPWVHVRPPSRLRKHTKHVDADLCRCGTRATAEGDSSTLRGTHAAPARPIPELCETP